MLCTHKKTLDIATSSSCDVIFQVKGNQIALKNDCQEYEALFEPIESYQEDVAKAHGRIEQRTAKIYLFKPADQQKWGEKLSYMAVISRYTERFCTKKKIYKQHLEKAYFVTSKKLTAKEFSSAIRNHWAIENCNHYVKDVTLKEDLSRIRSCPEVFATLRSFVLNVFRANKVNNIADELFINCLNFSNFNHYKFF